MKQSIEIEVPYGMRLVTDRTRIVVTGWLRFYERSWVKLQEICNEKQFNNSYYAEPWPIPEGWELVKAGTQPTGEVKVWSSTNKTFTFLPVGYGVDESAPPVIRKIKTEPEVFWGVKQKLSSQPHYLMPNDLVAAWDCLAGWSNKKGWAFRGFWITKGLHAPNKQLPWFQSDEGVYQACKWAKFVKGGE